MKKAISFILVLAILAGGFFYCMQAGLIDKWFPGVLEKVIPGYSSADSASGGRVSSNAENAVYMDLVSTIAELGSGTGQIERFGGVVEPQETREYKLDSDRTVKKCYVKEGDMVEKGDKLFTYDVVKTENELEQEKINLERMENQAKTTEAKKGELEKKKAQANTPEKQLEVLVEENTIKQEELALKQQKIKITALEEQIKNATVYSDMEGIVKSINDSMDTDSMTGESSAYITLLKTGTYRVKASVNEQNRLLINKGISMLVFSRVESGRLWHGTVTEIKSDQGSSGNESSDMYSGENSSGSTDYPFYVELENSDDLMLGQHVYLEQDVGQENAKEGLWLDDYYIVTEDGNTFVWAASDDNKVEKRTVKLGDADEELQQHQILSGLTVDDYICVPQENLEEGLPVSYNNAEDFEETESMYSWEDAAADGEWFDETEDWFWGEDETEDWDDEDMFYSEGEAAVASLFNGDAEEYEDDYEDEEEMTDEEGYIILD